MLSLSRFLTLASCLAVALAVGTQNACEQCISDGKKFTQQRKHNLVVQHACQSANHTASSPEPIFVHDDCSTVIDFGLLEPRNLYKLGMFALTAGNCGSRTSCMTCGALNVPNFPKCMWARTPNGMERCVPSSTPAKFATEKSVCPGESTCDECHRNAGAKFIQVVTPGGVRNHCALVGSDDAPGPFTRVYGMSAVSCDNIADPGLVDHNMIDKVTAGKTLELQSDSCFTITSCEECTAKPACEWVKNVEGKVGCGDRAYIETARFLMLQKITTCPSNSAGPVASPQQNPPTVARQGSSGQY